MNLTYERKLGSTMTYKTKPCPVCGGKKTMSKYDLGWRSVVHSEELDLQRACWRCGGLGTVEDNVVGKKK